MKKIIIIMSLFLLPLVFSNSAFATYEPNNINQKNPISYTLDEDQQDESDRLKERQKEVLYQMLITIGAILLLAIFIGFLIVVTGELSRSATPDIRLY
jgi:hypothetical protein